MIGWLVREGIRYHGSGEYARNKAAAKKRAAARPPATNGRKALAVLVLLVSAVIAVVWVAVSSGRNHAESTANTAATVTCAQVDTQLRAAYADGNDVGVSPIATVPLSVISALVSDTAKVNVNTADTSGLQYDAAQLQTEVDGPATGQSAPYLYQNQGWSGSDYAVTVYSTIEDMELDCGIS